MQTPSIPNFDAQAFRYALGHYASGITIIAGLECNAPVGFTCQSFYSVSIDPPLVSFSVMRTSSSWPRIRPAKSFTINVLREDQQAISNAFARSGTDKWAGIQWRPGHSGNPILQDCLLWLDCELFAEHEAGDHNIVIGRVLAMEAPAAPHPHKPLLYFNGRYHGLLPID